MRWRKWLVTSDFFHPYYYEREYNMASAQIALDIVADETEINTENEIQEKMNKEIQS